MNPLKELKRDMERTTVADHQPHTWHDAVVGAVNGITLGLLLVLVIDAIVVMLSK